MSMYVECELKKINIDEVLSSVRYIEPEDLVVLYREKIRRLESVLKKSEDDNIRRSEMNKELSDRVERLRNNNQELLKENGRLKEELRLVREDNDAFNEDVKQLVEENKRLRADLEESHANNIRLVAELRNAKDILVEVNKKLLNSQFGLQSMPYHDLMMENRRLLQKQASLETQINILNTNSDRYKDDIGKLMRENEELKTDNKHLLKENKKLIEERDALWDETQHLDKIYKQLLNEKKRLQENFEELKASSDLSLATELAEIFAEFMDKNAKNRDDLSVKIDEFREKYQFE